MNGKLYAKDGLLWRDGKPLSVAEADFVAQKLGRVHAEMLVESLQRDHDIFMEQYREWLINLGWTPPQQ